MYEGCKYAVMPSSNVAYWTNKLLGNKERDARVKQELEENGWNVLVVWECQLKGSLKEITLSNLYNALTGQ